MFCYTVWRWNNKKIKCQIGQIWSYRALDKAIKMLTARSSDWEGFQGLFFAEWKGKKWFVIRSGGETSASTRIKFSKFGPNPTRFVHHFGFCWPKRSPDDPQMIPRWSPNGPRWPPNDPQMIPKWSPDDPQMVPDDPEMMPRWSPDDVQMIPLWPPNHPSWRPNDA